MFLTNFETIPSQQHKVHPDQALHARVNTRPSGARRMTTQDDHDEHHEPDLDDDEMPGPNFLAQFRQPLTDEELEEAAKAFIAALDEILDEIRREQGST